MNLFTGKSDKKSGICGQVSPLTTQLRGILRDYGGHQLLNELLQNADDAGASVYKVCLDKRKNAFPSTKSLLTPQLENFQGPALYQFDNATFNEVDFESIQRVGDGLKRGDPTKTGQFGLGFNSCYHVTDLPCFISGEYFVMFDPHLKNLPAPVSGMFFNLLPDENGVSFIDRNYDQVALFWVCLGAMDVEGGIKAMVITAIVLESVLVVLDLKLVVPYFDCH